LSGLQISQAQIEQHRRLLGVDLAGGFESLDGAVVLAQSAIDQSKVRKSVDAPGREFQGGFISGSGAGKISGLLEVHTARELFVGFAGGGLRGERSQTQKQGCDRGSLYAQLRM
jgi:hypothetical protein